MTPCTHTFSFSIQVGSILLTNKHVRVRMHAHTHTQPHKPLNGTEHIVALTFCSSHPSQTSRPWQAALLASMTGREGEQKGEKVILPFRSFRPQVVGVRVKRRTGSVGPFCSGAVKPRRSLGSGEGPHARESETSTSAHSRAFTRRGVNCE